MENKDFLCEFVDSFVLYTNQNNEAANLAQCSAIIFTLPTFILAGGSPAAPFHNQRYLSPKLRVSADKTNVSWAEKHCPLNHYAGEVATNKYL